MMPHTVIALALLLSIIGIALWFHNGKNALKHIHFQTISHLENAISTNQDQISFRNSHLNNYDFQKYNLDEALVTQREIII